MILSDGDTQFRVGDQIADAGLYRFYFCQEVGTGRRCLLQIGNDAERNGDLDRAAFILRELKRVADTYEADFAAQNPGRRPLYYDQTFPELVTSFVNGEQGGRRINVLAFHRAEFITEMVPLAILLGKDGLRIDLKTSAWIMGRLLTLLAFSHELGVAVHFLDCSNVLFYEEPPGVEKHYALVLDWTHAYLYSDGIPASDRQNDIAQAAKTVFEAIGGNPLNGEYLYALDNADKPYVAYLWYLASGNLDDAVEAHTRFYELVYGLFGRTFHPFTTLPLG